jgi:hypothetical protein
MIRSPHIILPWSREQERENKSKEPRGQMSYEALSGLRAGSTATEASGSVLARATGLVVRDSRKS